MSASVTPSTPTVTATMPVGKPTLACQLTVTARPRIVRRRGFETLSVRTRSRALLVVTLTLPRGDSFARMARLYRDGSRRGVALTSVHLGGQGNRYRYRFSFLAGCDGSAALVLYVGRRARFGRVLVEMVALDLSCAARGQHRLTAGTSFRIEPRPSSATSLRVSLSVSRVTLPDALPSHKNRGAMVGLRVTTAPRTLVDVTAEIGAARRDDIGPGVVGHLVRHGQRIVAYFSYTLRRANQQGQVDIILPLRLSLLVPGHSGVVLLKVRARDSQGRVGAVYRVAIPVSEQRLP